MYLEVLKAKRHPATWREGLEGQMKQGSFGLKCISVWQFGTALTKFFSTVRYALHLPFAMSLFDS
jgi:hypothetical protein